jgi:DNA mismatch repair protein MutS
MTTPVRQQYLRIKKQFPDVIVMFSLGDFYETFDDDAKTVSEACNIVLTGRDMGTGQRVPLGGVPYHAIENDLAKLVQAGHKVAIVEQLVTPEEARQNHGRGSLTREVARAVSPKPPLLWARIVRLSPSLRAITPTVLQQRGITQ